MSENIKEKVFKEYYLKVRNFLLGKVNNYYLAEDLCSEIFEKIYSKIDSYNPSKASLSTWVFTIARNSLIDYYRTRRNDIELNEDIDLEVQNDDEGLIYNKDNLEKLAKSLKELTKKEKTVIILHYYKDLSLKDSCKIMNISYPYIKIIHRNALRKLKHNLKIN